jgi:hypothetical protein
MKIVFGAVIYSLIMQRIFSAESGNLMKRAKTFCDHKNVGSYW